MSDRADNDEKPGNMAGLRFVATEFEMLRRVKVSGSSAAQIELLRYVARKLRSGDQLGAELSHFIAVAFERATSLDDLGIGSGHRLPEADWAMVAQFIGDQSDPMPDRYRKAARKFKISTKTARRYWDQYRSALDNSPDS